MVTTVSIIVAVMALSFAVFQMIRNLRAAQGYGFKVKRMIWMLCLAAIVFSLGALGGGGNPCRLLMESTTAMQSMYMTSKNIDVVTLINELVMLGTYDEAGGREYLKLIAEAVLYES